MQERVEEMYNLHIIDWKHLRLSEQIRKREGDIVVLIVNSIYE